MTTHYNTAVRWYLGGIHIACHAKSATFSSRVEALDVTPLCDGEWVTLAPGRKSGSFNHSLMSDFDEGGLDELLFSQLGVKGTPQSWSVVAPGGTADGALAYVTKSLSTNYVPVQGAPGELAMASVAGSTDGPIARGMVLHPHDTARTTSSAGTEREVGAVLTGQRLYAALHVLEVSGTSPTLDVVVQSDTTGFGSPTDQITFAQATDVGAEFASVVGPITDTFWRVTWTVGGTTPSFAFAVLVGIG